MPIRMYESRGVEVRPASAPPSGPVQLPEPAVPLVDSAERVLAAPRASIDRDYGARPDVERLPRVTEQSTFREVPKGYEVLNTTPFTLKVGR